MAVTVLDRVQLCRIRTKSQRVSFPNEWISGIGLYASDAIVVKENLDLFEPDLTEDGMEQIAALDRGEKHDWY